MEPARSGRASVCLSAPTRNVLVDDLPSDALGEFDRQLVLIDCRHDVVAEHRVRNVIANREFGRACNSGNSINGSLRVRGLLGCG